jgi:hypothetical protein
MGRRGDSRGAEGMRMQEPELLARLEKLERENKRFRRLGVTAVVVAAALAGMYATRTVPLRDHAGVPGVVKAHELEIVDSRGKARIKLTTVMGGTYVTLLDSQGTTREGMFLGSDGSPHIALDDAQVKARLSMDVDSDGSPNVSLSDAQGQVPLDLGVGSDGSSEVRLSDTHGMPRAVVGVLADGSPYVTLLGSSPDIKLSDAEGFEMDLGTASTVSIATGETHQTSADSIVMFGNDKKHRVMWKAPYDPPRLPSATPLAPRTSSPPNLVVPSAGHSASILGNHADGAYLKLDDGKSYVVDAVDRVTSALWLVGDDLVVDSSSRSCDRVQLVNVDEYSEAVCATPVQ